MSSDQEIGDDDLITVAGGDVRLDVAIPARPCGLPIRVKVRDSEGMPRTATDIRAYHKDTDTWTYPRSRDIDSGLFHLPVTPGTYRFYVDLAHGCGGFATISGLTFFGQDQARQFQVADTPIDVDLQVPVGTCQYEIAGTLHHKDGSPADDFVIWFHHQDNSIITPAQVTEDGTFGREAREPGNYTIQYYWPDQRCNVYVLGDTITLNPAEAEQFKLVDTDAYHNIRIPDGTCEHQITGMVVNSNGAPVVNAMVSICDSDSGVPCSASALTDDNGSFALFAPINSPYRLIVRHGDMYADDLFSIHDADITGIIVTLVPSEPNDG